MKLLALTRYDAAGASSRYRTYQYLPLLRAAGLEVEEAPLLDQGYIARLYGRSRQSNLHLFRTAARRIGHLLDASRYDLLWIEKELFPYGPAFIERVLHLARTPFVVDYDDAIFHRYDQHRSRLVRAVLGRKIDHVMRSACLVVAGNRYLADRAQRAGAAAVEVLPTVIDIARYPAKTGPKGNRGLTIGWIGSPSTQAYLRRIAGPLALLCAEGAHVVAIGARPEFSMAGVPIEIAPWTEAGEIAALQRLDVGIMPLPDEPFERGKCGFKLIQYMGCSLPVVASAIGANTEIVVEGETGFLARSDEQWLAALRTLGSSSSLRARMGKAGRARVESQYSLQSTAPRLIELLRRAGRARESPSPFD